jgi:hypothetical protein
MQRVNYRITQSSFVENLTLWKRTGNQTLWLFLKSKRIGKKVK